MEGEGEEVLGWDLEGGAHLEARVHFAAFPEPNGIRFGQNRNPFGSVENLLRVRDFTDVTLVSEGETKNGAHKVILISASHRKIQ